MHFVCTYTSCYFLILDDEYGYLHYDDDDDHGSYCTRGYANLKTLLQTASSTTMGPWGVRIAWGSTLMRVDRG